MVAFESQATGTTGLWTKSVTTVFFGRRARTKTLRREEIFRKILVRVHGSGGMWGSRPSHFMIIPNTKRHPNNTKTDQLPISEVTTGLPGSYHNNARPKLEYFRTDSSKKDV